jgi:hypothetical protein
MSGAEATAVISLISAVIGIVQATKQVYDVANDAKDLPEAFREVGEKLPLVEDTLRLAEASVDDKSAKIIKPVIETCKGKATILKELVQKVVPKADASRTQRYWTALRTLDKGSRVETLMKEILENLHLLADHGSFKVAKNFEELAAAIDKLSKIEPSAPDEIFDGPTDTVNNQNFQNASGNPKFNTSLGRSRQYNADNQYFGKED